jgi:hypothetical protein
MRKLRFGVVAVIALALAVLPFQLSSSGVGMPPAPGGDATAAGTLTDDNTKLTYDVEFEASEDSDQQGVGDTNLHVGGPSLSACSVHGPGAEADSLPFLTIQCGEAFGQSVRVDQCVATVELHGFSHSDWPLVNYLGSSTVEVRLQRLSSTSATMDVTIYTPKEAVVLHGKLTGDVTISTC